MKIALLEFIDELESLTAYINENNLNLKDFQIVAFEPKLQAYLMRRNIEFENTLPYFTNDSHRRIICETEKVMKIVRTEFNFVDSNGLEECYKENFAFYLRFFISHLFKLIEIISNIHKEYPKVTFWAYVSRKINHSIFISDDERYLGMLAEQFCRSRKIDFANLNEEIVDIASATKCAMPAHRKQKFGILEEVWALAMLNFFTGKKNIVMPKTPRAGYTFNGFVSKICSIDKEIMFVDIRGRFNLLKCVGHNLFALLASFLDRKHPAHYIMNISYFSKKPTNEEKMLLDRSIKAVLQKICDDKLEFLGVNFSDLVTKKTKYAFKTYLENMLSDSHNLKFAMNKLKTQLVISYFGRNLMSVAGELSRVAGKKSLFVSHGTHPVPIDEVHEVELYNLCKGFMLGTYTHIALSTPVQEKHLHYFKNKYPEIHNQAIKVEPLVFAQVDNLNRKTSRAGFGLQDREILLTHATSMNKRHAERFHFIETTNELLSSLSDLVNAVNVMDGTKLLIKLHPGFPLSCEEINSLLPISTKVSICRDMPFATALAATDILISYSSTAIDEALINRIPVLLYDKWCRYNHFETSVYNETESGNLFPVCYVNDRENIGDAIDYLKRKVTSIRKDKMDMSNYCYDDDYARELSTFLKDTLTI